MSQKIACVQARYQITGILRLESGLHIGSSGDFSPIGAVDSVVIRDGITQEPVIPGSSIKGKMRSLLAADTTESVIVPDVTNEPDHLQRLFGAGGKQIRRSRLQFYDLFLTRDSLSQLEKADTDLYLSEVKFENTITRATGVANPRQIERVPRGAEFAFKLNYLAENFSEIMEDFSTLAKGLRLLSIDYLGQGGSRGNGKVSFKDVAVAVTRSNQSTDEPDCLKLQEVLNASINQ